MKWTRSYLSLQVEFNARSQTIFVQSRVLDYHGVWTLRLKMTEVLRECYSHAHDVLTWETGRWCKGKSIKQSRHASFLGILELIFLHTFEEDASRHVTDVLTISFEWASCLLYNSIRQQWTWTTVIYAVVYLQTWNFARRLSCCWADWYSSYVDNSCFVNVYNVYT